jgi:hypothetical protein
VGHEQTMIQSVKENKKVSIIKWLKIYLTFHTTNATKKKNNYMNL